MRVLVTGGTGFIGSQLVKYYLDRDNDVTVISRGIHKNKYPGVKYIEKDIGQIEREVINMDLIIHCASTVNDYNLLESSNIDLVTNNIGTWKLLESCRQFNPWVRLVFVSTFFVCGNPKSNPVSEEDVCSPLGLYGATKLASEHFCKTYANVFDLDVSIARCTNVYGPMQNIANQKTAAFNWMVKQCCGDLEIPLYDNGKIRRDYLYIDDAVTGIDAVATHGAKSEVYFVGTGEGTSFKQMVDMMIYEAGGGRIRVVKSPGFHQRVGIGDFWCNPAKVKELGWEPKTSLREGIRKTVAFYRES